MIELNGLTSLAGKPIAALSNILNTPNSAEIGRSTFRTSLTLSRAARSTTRSTARSC